MNRKLVATVGRRMAQAVLLLVGLLALTMIVLWILFGAQTLDVS